MNVEKYQELTGESVPADDQARIESVIRRTQSKLESLLGFSLRSKNLYTEKGKVQFEGFLPLEIVDEDLLPADEEQGRYKLFPFNDKDEYLHTDPFKNIWHVKLVMPLQEGEFVTIVDLDNVIAQYGRDNIGKYIARHYEWFTWAWYLTWRYSWKSNVETGLMLAVDADWIDCYPDDLMYLWADMVTYYSNPNYSLLGNIKSESVDGHSWSVGSAGGGKGGDTPPELNPMNRQILSRYAGPYGSIARNPVR